MLYAQGVLVVQVVKSNDSIGTKAMTSQHITVTGEKILISNAATGNRTRAAWVTGEHSTTSL